MSTNNTVRHRVTQSEFYALCTALKEANDDVDIAMTVEALCLHLSEVLSLYIAPSTLRKAAKSTGIELVRPVRATKKETQEQLDAVVKRLRFLEYHFNQMAQLIGYTGHADHNRS